jgi:WD40 repeat protein
MIKLWDFATGECLRTYRGHGNLVSSVALTSNNRNLVSAGNDDVINLWDMKTGTCLHTFTVCVGLISSIVLIE